MVSVCPECRARLTPTIYSCSGCGTTFRDENTMRQRVLLIPGGGYFYAGHPGVGIVFAIGEAYIVLLFLIMLIGALGSTPEERVGMIVLALVFVGVLAVEKLFSFSHARYLIREFIPAGPPKPAIASSATAR
jgi:hypothetical protein